MEEIPKCCQKYEEESDSECCSCDTCSCESGSCCGSSASSDCSSCSCSPRGGSGGRSKYIQDLDAIKTFITDIAELIKQTKNANATVEVKPATEREVDSGAAQAPKEGDKLPEEAVSPSCMDPTLEREIAHMEAIINNTEMNLRNNYAADGAVPLNIPVYTHSPMGSPWSYGASTAMVSEMYDCCTNDHTTVTDAFSYSNSPIAGDHVAWQSGFDMPTYGAQWEEEQPDLDNLYSRMVALDLHSYMYLVETVLDQRVRSEMAPVF